MDYVIQDYLIKQNLENAKPKDVMPILIGKDFFEKYYRDGLSLRNLLRVHDDENMLYLLPQVSVERKDKKRYWYFNTLKI